MKLAISLLLAKFVSFNSAANFPTVNLLNFGVEYTYYHDHDR